VLVCVLLVLVASSISVICYQDSNSSSNGKDTYKNEGAVLLYLHLFARKQKM